MINVGNYVGKDNTPRLPVQPARAAAATGAPARTTANERSPGRRAGHILAIVGPIAGRVLLGWLAAIPRRLGDQLFAANDAEAYWRDWQTTRTLGGLGRRYTDPRFGTLDA